MEHYFDPADPETASPEAIPDLAWPNGTQAGPDIPSQDNKTRRWKGCPTARISTYYTGTHVFKRRVQCKSDHLWKAE